METAAYFVVSEVLNNMVKHASPSQVRVIIEGDDGSLTGTSEDDGVGAPRIDADSGLHGPCDRVAALEGRLELDSPANGGTRPRTELPCG